MPVHKVKGGYKFGKSGKLYRGKGAKKKTQRQVRAIYASGYREKKKDMTYKLNGNSVMAWQYNGASEMSEIPSWVDLLFKKNVLHFSETKQDVDGKALYFRSQYIGITDYVVRLPNNEIVLLSENQFKTLFVESEEINSDDVSVNFNGKLSKDIHSELLKLPAECYLNVYHEMQSKVFGGTSYFGCGGAC